MHNLIALLHYFGVVQMDGDWLNDWLTHMTPDIADLAQALGHFLAGWGG